eukprot:11225778-Lingulodinium_polyedra.AAC.1
MCWRGATELPAATSACHKLSPNSPHRLPPQLAPQRRPQPECCCAKPSLTTQREGNWRRVTM